MLHVAHTRRHLLARLLTRESASPSPLAGLAFAVTVAIAKEILPVEARDFLAHFNIAQHLDTRRISSRRHKL